jgi:hypothetical protein
MNKILVALSAVITWVALGMTNAHATVVFEQLPTYDGPNYISSPLDGAGEPGARAADNFMLGSNTTIHDVHWWGFHVPSISSGFNDFTFTFYSDAAGLPGSVLLTTGGSLVIEDDTNPGSPVVYDKFYSSFLDSPFEAVGGVTYWLSIFNGASDAAWAWRSSSDDGELIARTNLDPIDWSQTLTVNLNFQLTTKSVPVPATLALMSIGLVGLGCRRHKQKAAA